MGTDSAVSVALIVAVVGLIATIYNMYASRKKDVQNDDARLEEIKTSVLKANMKLDQVCATTTDIKSDIKSMQNFQAEMDKRLTIVERDIHTLWKRIDEGGHENDV